LALEIIPKHWNQNWPQIDYNISSKSAKKPATKLVKDFPKISSWSASKLARNWRRNQSKIGQKFDPKLAPKSAHN
jgi:hypothetical protein